MEITKQPTQSTALQGLSATSQYKGLTIAEKEIAAACLEPNIRNFTDVEFRKNMLVLIGKTHLNCGFKLDETQVGLTIGELCADLKKYNGTLSFQEIQIAFNNGYKKQYGDFFGLNNATYFQWVNAYAWGVSRSNAKKAIEDSKKPVAKPQPSQEEKEQIIKDGALKVFNDHKAGVEILDPGNVVFNYLEEKGILDLPPEEAKKLIAESKEKMIQDAILNKGIKPVAKVIEGVISNKGVIVANAKRMALKRYFDSLIEMEIDLSEELNNKV